MSVHCECKRRRKRNCLHCGQLFLPDYRNLRHQNYCFLPACRQASKRASQARWLASEKGQGYFSGPEHGERVRRWRAAHADTPSRARRLKKEVLQDHCSAQSVENKAVTPPTKTTLLQDVISLQPLILLGIISQLTGLTVQDDIEQYVRRFLVLGQDILGPNFHLQPQGALSNDRQTHSTS